jgi:hypothetical protein
MGEFVRPRVVGFNHVALEVGGLSMRRWRSKAVSSDLNCAAKVTPWPSSIWAISLSPFRRQPADDGRHFGLVVDDKEAACKALEAVGVILLDGPFLDFRDPLGQPSRDPRLRQCSVHQSA